MKKIKELDIIRSLLIILVVFGHSIINDIRNNNEVYKFIWSFIYNFHMASFFILSGITYYINKSKYKYLKKFIIKKFKKLIIPYFIISSLFIIPFMAFKIIVYKIDIINSFIESIISIFTFQGNIVTHLWFIYTLFIIFIITWILEKILGYNLTLVFSLILNIIISFITIRVTILAKVMYYLFYFVLGKKVFESFNNLNKLKINISIIIFIISQSVLLYTNSEKTTIYNILFHILCKISSIYVLFVSSKYLLKFNKIMKILNILKSYTYEIYLIHQPIFTVGVGYFLFNIMKINSTLVVVISTISGIILPIITINLYKNIRKKLI